MTETISTIFDYFPGNHGLTEEVIYNSQPSNAKEIVPIFSGSQDNIMPIAHIRIDASNNKGEPLSYFEGPCLILTKDGSAGLITFKDKGLFTINHHACVLKVKNMWSNRVDMEWFAQQYKSSLLKYVTSKSDNRVFSTKWFERIRFEIPSYKTQLKQKRNKLLLVKLKNKLNDISKELKNLLENHTVDLKYELYETPLLSHVFNFKGGNSGLTEDFIYYNQPTNDAEKLLIFTGATLEENRMGQISRTAKPKNRNIKLFQSPAILVVRKGVAGKMFYIDDGDFTTNDDAYVLIPKREWIRKINMKWFIHEYQSLFFNLVTSKSDNATFNQEYAKRQSIIVPDIKLQNNIAEKIKYIEVLLANIKKIEKQAGMILDQKII